MHTQKIQTHTRMHAHTITSMYFCIDFLVPAYTQFGLLCVTETAVVLVRSRHKQLSERHEKRKRQRGGERDIKEIKEDEGT